jgi:hypothetical protein
MKRIASTAFLLVFALPALAAPASPAPAAPPSQPLPTPFPQARYASMSEKSPFAVATATAPAAAATPGFATQLYLQGVGHLLGNDYVVIKSRDTDKPEAIYVEVGKTTDDGITVDHINWSEETGKSTAEVHKGAEKATLIYDEAQIHSTAVAQVAQPGVRMPIFPGQRPVGFPLQNPNLQRPGFPAQPGFAPRPGLLPGSGVPAPATVLRRRVIGSP